MGLGSARFIPGSTDIIRCAVSKYRVAIVEVQAEAEAEVAFVVYSKPGG